MKKKHQIPGRDSDIKRKKTQQGWKKYIGDLFPYEREQSTLPRTIERLEILKYKMKTTLDNLGRNKLAGADGIVMMILAVCDDLGNKILFFLLFALSVQDQGDHVSPQFPAYSIA